MWRALADRFERVTEQAADLAEPEVVEFIHVAGETAAQTIARFEFRVRRAGSKEAKCHLVRGHTKRNPARPSLGALRNHSDPMSSFSGNQAGLRMDLGFNAQLRQSRAKIDSAGMSEGAALQAAMERALERRKQ